MAALPSERQPLLPTSNPRQTKPTRTVAFSDDPPATSSSSATGGRGALSGTPSSLQTLSNSPTRPPPPVSNPTYPLPYQSVGHGSNNSNTTGQPMLSTLNNKLRRRNSAGAPLTGNSKAGLPGAVLGPQQHPASKIGPQRTTKNAQKLKLLPNPDPGDEGRDEESGREVYSQFTRIKDPTARRDAARLGKADRERLPRVTAYCTASAYKLDGLMKFLKARTKTRGTAPKQFDECIYSPFDYGSGKGPRRGSGGDASQSQQQMLQRMASEEAGAVDTSTTDRDGEQPSDTGEQSKGERPAARRRSDSALEIEEHTQVRRDDLLTLASTPEEAVADAGTEGSSESSEQPGAIATASDLGISSAEVSASAAANNGSNPDLDIEVHTPEVFLFDYGTVVIWGMTLAQEKRFLKDIAKFESEKLAPDDVETEEFNFYYTREYQARIYNDFISLREKRNYMTKLAISHALSQSVKTSLFEDLLSTTIADTTPLPGLLATTGRISLSRRAINKKIGELFILRINIHLQGSVLDSPELMWAEPRLEPVYAAVRSYLEMDQRVELMTERLGVLGDLLAVLRDQVGTRHGEYLEWIVIVLIAAEILVAGINIVVDLYAGVD